MPWSELHFLLYFVMEKCNSEHEGLFLQIFTRNFRYNGDWGGLLGRGCLIRRNTVPSLSAGRHCRISCSSFSVVFQLVILNCTVSCKKSWCNVSVFSLIFCVLLMFSWDVNVVDRSIGTFNSVDIIFWYR